MEIRQHTAQSLALYLGREVMVKGVKCRFTNVGMKFGGNIDFDVIEVDINRAKFALPPFDFSAVFPILKPFPPKETECPVDEGGLPKGVLWDGKVNQPNEKVEWYDTIFEFAEGIEFYAKYAYPNPESPTGYVDLFGYPCVVGK